MTQMCWCTSLPCYTGRAQKASQGPAPHCISWSAVGLHSSGEGPVSQQSSPPQIIIPQQHKKKHNNFAIQIWPSINYQNQAVLTSILIKLKTPCTRWWKRAWINKWINKCPGRLHVRGLVLWELIPATVLCASHRAWEWEKLLQNKLVSFKRKEESKK